MADEKWLNAAETAKRMGLRVDQLSRYVRDGKLPEPSYRFGPKSPRWDVDELDASMGVTQVSRKRNVVMPSGLANAILARHQARRQKTAR
ncbi:hypothetical protein ACELLULO517_07450 [Acidisoma cellulosilytica]|uniref:DNA-binding protein n=1 Tax=Acidisoma cellulosilyticum TaxID=2802395 RepID=A0A964E2W3_9PROT|nr:hypothetical protein [Acidisoma cellulosilyticum]MCB8880065.1 hypothetical protein [Acidisoma cellulosilyticum]